MDLALVLLTGVIAASGIVTFLHIRRSSHQELRAYVSVAIDLPKMEGEARSIEWIVQVENRGKTPAERVTVSLDTFGERFDQLEVAAPRMRPSPGWPGTPIIDEGYGSIHPGQRLLLVRFFNRPSDVQLYEWTDNRGVMPCIGGSIWYDDVFGKTHFTHFLGRLVWLESRQGWHVWIPLGPNNSTGELKGS